VVEFGEWLCEEVLKYVSHRQWVVSIPKRLRIYFMFDRKLLTKLSRCAWKVLNLYLTQAIPYDDAIAGAAIAVQSFGDFQNFHPHLHVLATDEALGRKEGLAINYTNLGTIYQTRGELDRACEYWGKSLKLYTDIGAQNFIRQMGAVITEQCKENR